MAIDFKESECDAREAARQALDKAGSLLASGDKKGAEEQLLIGYEEVGRALLFRVVVPPREREQLPRQVDHIGDGWLSLVIERLRLGALKDVELRGYTKFLEANINVAPSAITGFD